MNLRKIDPTFCDWTPKTAAEAIDLYFRIKRAGISDWDKLPEIFQRCARALDQTEHDLFAAWICNPTGIKPGAPDPFPADGLVPPAPDQEAQDEKIDE